MELKDLNNKKILILGLEEEGIDNLFFVKKKIKYKSLGVADVSSFKKNDPKIKHHLTDDIKQYFGKEYLSSISKYDVILKSPGIPLHSLPVGEKQIVTSQTDIFLSSCKTKIIGITGTKGKSTTCMLLNNTLKKAGRSVDLIGNIGRPVFSYLAEDKKNDYFIYELSSFQLQTISKGPKIAVFLNIFKDHLDKHKDFEDYLSSKEKITMLQDEKDFFVYNEDDGYVKEIAKKTKANKIPFSITESPILKVLEILKIDKKYFFEAQAEFSGLPHRKEYLGKHRGIHFYNDSAATIPEATIKAIFEIKNIQTIIVGGSSKGADFSLLVEKIKKSKIQNIVVFKDTCKDFQEKIKLTGKIIYFVANMEEAVACCFRNTDPGMVCLLSPGFASFNMFKNYKERGDQFRKFISN
jgi:UDP-N-acetylmuramoyl-L-alanine---L-glutamate ligase